ncbi:MAG: hypothetical protein ACFCU8_03950 [Thermosynechococcaceae cyanobacterium]
MASSTNRLNSLTPDWKPALLGLLVGFNFMSDGVPLLVLAFSDEMKLPSS